MRSIRLIVFDWDGTLVDSSDHIVASLHHAARSLGWPLRSSTACKNVIGLSMDRVLESLYPKENVQGYRRFKASYRDYFFGNEMDATKPFEGASNVMDALLENGYWLAVATGKGLNGLELALDATGLRPYFASYRCAETTASKPDPLMLLEILKELKVDPENTVMIGDTTFDMIMADHAEVKKIAATYGVHERSRLEALHPDYLIDSIEELLNVFRVKGHVAPTDLLKN